MKICLCFCCCSVLSFIYCIICYFIERERKKNKQNKQTNKTPFLFIARLNYIFRQTKKLSHIFQILWNNFKMSLRDNNTMETTLLDLPVRNSVSAVTRDGLAVRDLMMRKTASSYTKSTHMAARKAGSCLALGIWIMCKFSV